jgi:hypothetical protein
MTRFLHYTRSSMSTSGIAVCVSAAVVLSGCSSASRDQDSYRYGQVGGALVARETLGMGLHQDAEEACEASFSSGRSTGAIADDIDRDDFVEGCKDAIE